MRKYYLYALFDPNLKIPKYIGISNNPERRFKEHLEDISVTKKTKWINELKHGGFLPILKVIKETDNIRQVCAWEIQSIKKLKDKFNLVNTTAGGEYYAIGTPIQEFDLDGNYIDHYNSMIEYCELHNLKPNAVSGISAVCLRKRNYCYNRIFRYAGDCVTEDDLIKLKKSLHQRDPKSVVITDLKGNILYEFDSIQQCKQLGSYSMFSEVLSWKYTSVYNKYLVMHSIDEYPDRLQNYIIHRSKGKLDAPINKYTLSGKYLDTYYTYNAAADSCKGTIKNRSAIRKCIEGEYSQAFGYIWKKTYVIGNIHVETPIKKRPNNIIIQQYDTNGNLINTYKSYRQVTTTFNFCYATLKKYIKENKLLEGYIWQEIQAV